MNGKQLKNSILQWAIQGKLVPQDPNDEPASVLLEKIRQEKERLIKEKKIKRDKNASIIYRGEDNSYYEKFLATGEVKCIDEEIPFEIPNGWEWCRLSNIGITETGTTPSKTHPEYFGDYMPFLGPANILDDKIVKETQGLSFEGVKYGRVIPANSILQVCIGGSIGKCAIVHKEVTFNQQINSLTPIICCVEYVHYVLQSETFRLAIIAKATGTATPIINRGNWEQLLFPLPPLVEQHRIVATLNVLKDIVAHYSETQIRLQDLNNGIKSRLSKSILQEAIQGKLVPQDPNDEPASVLLERIKEEKTKLFKEGKLKKKDLVDSVIFKGDDNKYYEQTGSEIACIDDTVPFDLPTSWCWVRHNQLFEVSGGSQPPKSHFIDHYREGYIRLYQIRDYGSNPVPVYVPINEISKTTRKGDILLARYGGSLGKVFWAEEGAYNVAMAKVIPLYKSELIHKEYIFLYYCSNIYQSTILDHSRSAQAGFNKYDLADMLFPLPPYSEQVRIVERYQSIVTSIMRG